MMFNPIIASANIKKRFEDYITTTFNIADKEYAELLKEALHNGNAISKGPFLDIGDSYKTGRSIRELIQCGIAAELFDMLEIETNDGAKELPILRPLYLHQEEAMLRSKDDRSMIITTGTGSGKTECFTIPIINHLLEECAQGPLGPGVRAIIIYPMNALANDQMKRFRRLLKDINSNNGQITFGLYNSNTEQKQENALKKYREQHKDALGHPMEPLPNEVISREEMRNNPPHILITNYAMLEYMMLRPNDDAVFSGAQLKFIVLDEAHIYRGATGMETALLIRRLKARISEPSNVRFILTSATLGNKEFDSDIVQFANNLCDATFTYEDIIRSQPVKHEMPDGLIDVPIAVFEEIAYQSATLNEILLKHNLDFAPGSPSEERIFELGIRSKIYHLIRGICRAPMTIDDMVMEICDTMPITSNELATIIFVLAQGEKSKISLLKARYHTFMRALEGAYITLSQPKLLSLQRVKDIIRDDSHQKVFECAVCDDCGRVAICGVVNNDILEQSSDKRCENIRYFLLKECNESEFLNDDDDDELIDSSKREFIICAKCGKLSRKGNENSEFCKCGSSSYVEIREASRPKNSDELKCPVCNWGKFRNFYLGNEAATAVLATSLFEELPNQEVVQTNTSIKTPENSIFGFSETHKMEKIQKERQFLCFSDSRGEAAYFACYMSKSYQELLRRRGIWNVVKENQKEMNENPWEIRGFVEELAAYFNENRTFSRPEDGKETNLTAISRKNAWIAILNEMFNARRNTSLVSHGIISFEYRGNSEEAVQSIVDRYMISKKEARSLLELLVMDIVYYGAIQGDGSLTDTDREYIFYSARPKMIKKCKTIEDKSRPHLSGWAARTREEDSDKYYRNARLIRLMNCLGCDESEANTLLGEYWDSILVNGPEPLTLETRNEYFFKTDKFRIRAGTVDGKVYQCKKCGRICIHNCKSKCVSVKCSGLLKEISSASLMQNNHYINLYSSSNVSPLNIKEHTAQLGRVEQDKYQDWFINKKLNALSCSTTFEMGVDVGSLETIYLRNVPPSPANYIQRAGRAGRSTHSAAFCLTYAKLSSHDFTYFEEPQNMIGGKVAAPVFTIENEKVINRHIFAVALSSFFKVNPQVYEGNNANELLNESGFELLCDYLVSKPKELMVLLQKSIPITMHECLGIDNFTWTDKLIGKDGVLTIGINDFRDMVRWYEQQHQESLDNKDYKKAVSYDEKKRNFRRGKDDKNGRNDLIEFLVRCNVLPKYGFPVDTVELQPNINYSYGGKLQMVRDLQLAIAEYAPGSKIVADGKLYTSRYIKKLPTKTTGQDWEFSSISICPNQQCNSSNYSRMEIPSNGLKCYSCGKNIERARWEKAIEPRKGFVADINSTEDIPMSRPERSYRSDDYYIGDKERRRIAEFVYKVGNSSITMHSTSNDSLMVICDDGFFVCKSCGYAESSKENLFKPRFNPYVPYIEREHINAFGQKCVGKRLDRYRLSHVFRTDVVRMIFNSPLAKNKSTMLSVLFALLEAISKELDIERTDIKGCLQKIKISDNNMAHAIVIYDAVSGGAGQVRRLVTDDASILERVLNRALFIVEECNCDPSCYKCLRNYYNQKIHDQLNRKIASTFLGSFIGKPTRIEIAAMTTSGNERNKDITSSTSLTLIEDEVYALAEFNGWKEIAFLLPDEHQDIIKKMDLLNVKLPDFGNARMESEFGCSFMATLVWRKEKVLMFDDAEQRVESSNWMCLKLNEISPEKLKEVLSAREEIL